MRRPVPSWAVSATDKSLRVSFIMNNKYTWAIQNTVMHIWVTLNYVNTKKHEVTYGMK